MEEKEHQEERGVIEDAGEVGALHRGIVEGSRLVRENTHTRGRCEDRMRQVEPLKRGRLGHFELSCGKLQVKRHFAKECWWRHLHSGFDGISSGQAEYQCT